MATKLGIALLGLTCGGVTFLITGLVAFLVINGMQDHSHTGTRAGGGDRGAICRPAACVAMGRRTRPSAGPIRRAEAADDIGFQATRLLSLTFFHGTMLSATLRVELMAACVSCA